VKTRFRRKCVPLESDRGFVASGLLLLLLLGPPTLRFRDPQASLRGELDVAAVIVLLTWLVAGVWIIVELHRIRSRGAVIGMPPVQTLGIALSVALGCSVLTSPAVPLTAFKAYQTFVAITFGFLFVRRFGIRLTINRVLLAQLLLCAAVLAAALVAPDLVVKGDDSGYRIRGDAIVLNTGQVAVFALILLLSRVSRISGVRLWSLTLLCVTVLVLSRTRTAYAVFLIFLLASAVIHWRHMFVRGFLYFCGTSVAILVVPSARSAIGEWIVRDPGELFTLSDRLGLWGHLGQITWERSPLLGLGYWAASRVHGVEYNPALAAAHSVPVEVFAGAGLLGAVLLILVWLVLAMQAVRLLYQRRDGMSFAVCSLLFSAFLFSCLGWGELSAGPVGMTFWCLAAIIPVLTTATVRSGRAGTISPS
jgi:hypothetical protein